MKTFCLGDVHGAHKALLQVIERSGIDKDEDQLIFLGDTVDGWHETPECIDTLLEFKNLIAIRGNHDSWFMRFAQLGYKDSMWLDQGGYATLERYEGKQDLIDRHMNEYFSKTKIYHVDEKRNYAFMHGGYDWHMKLSENSDSDIMWNRHMVETAQAWKYEKHSPHGNLLSFKEFDKIFVGHTTTQHSFNRIHQGSTLPAFLSNLINLDTGCGWDGKLTIVDVDTLKFWQSDLVTELYKDLKNARK